MFSDMCESVAEVNPENANKLFATEIILCNNTKKTPEKSQMLLVKGTRTMVTSGFTNIPATRYRKTNGILITVYLDNSCFNETFNIGLV